MYSSGLVVPSRGSPSRRGAATAGAIAWMGTPAGCRQVFTHTCSVKMQCCYSSRKPHAAAVFTFADEPRCEHFQPSDYIALLIIAVNNTGPPTQVNGSDPRD